MSVVEIYDQSRAVCECVLRSFMQYYMIATPCGFTLSESIHFAGQHRCLEAYYWKA